LPETDRAELRRRAAAGRRLLTPDERARELIAALRRGGVRQAGFFVATGNLERPAGAGGEARIAGYVAAGHVIANHSHRWPHRTTARQRATRRVDGPTSSC
jgi:peptidoglycan/xylan/chitin deacetylase (PgdA/CDA1 family)